MLGGRKNEIVEGDALEENCMAGSKDVRIYPG
jgi:hypothetical protein